MRDYRNLSALVVALTLMQFATGALGVTVPLALEAQGASLTAIGLVAGFYGFGFVFGAVAAPGAIRAVGHIRAFAGFAAVAAALTLLLSARVDPLVWAFVRFGVGACVAALFAAGESWLTDAAPQQRRGALLGFYHVATKAGLILGPFAISGAAPGAAGAFMMSAAFFALCLVPIAATRQAQPPPPSSEPFGPGKLYEVAPAAVAAAFGAGVINGAVMSLAAVYASPLNPAEPVAAAAAFNAALMIGGMAAQWPAGAVSDRVDRRTVIAVLAVTAAAASIVLTLAPSATPGWLILAFAALYGAGGLSFYGVAVAHAADRAPPGQTARMMAGMLIVWAAGAMVGPFLAGLLMDSPLRERGLFCFAAAGLAFLAFAMVRRRAARSAPETEMKTPFQPAPATSPAVADLDPRADETGREIVVEEETEAETTPLRSGLFQASTETD